MLPGPQQRPSTWRMSEELSDAWDRDIICRRQSRHLKCHLGGFIASKYVFPSISTSARQVSLLLSVSRVQLDTCPSRSLDKWGLLSVLKLSERRHNHASQKLAKTLKKFLLGTFSLYRRNSCQPQQWKLVGGMWNQSPKEQRKKTKSGCQFLSTSHLHHPEEGLTPVLSICGSTITEARHTEQRALPKPCKAPRSFSYYG